MSRVVRVWKSSHFSHFYSDFAHLVEVTNLFLPKKRPQKNRSLGVTMVRSGCAPLGRPSAKSEGWVQFTISCREGADRHVWRQVGTKNTTVFGQASSTVLTVVCNRNFPSLPSRIWWFIQKWEMSNQDWRFLYRKRLCPFAGAAGKWKVAIWDHFFYRSFP